MPVSEIKPHAEVQRQAGVPGGIQDVIWRQPDLGLGIEEGKKIEAGWSDADFVCDVDADILRGQCGLSEGDPGLPTTGASPVQKHFQAFSGGHGLSSVPVGLPAPGGGPPLAQRHVLDSWPAFPK